MTKEDTIQRLRILYVTIEDADDKEAILTAIQALKSLNISRRADYLYSNVKVTKEEIHRAILNIKATGSYIQSVIDAYYEANFK